MEYLFVVTYGRSGSTVLINLLNSIDGYCIRGENGGVIADLAKAAHTLQTMKSRQDHQGNIGPHRPWYGIGMTQPEALARSLAEEFTRSVLVPPEGTRVTGFKEIRYTSEHLDEESFDATMDFMATRFERSRFLFNTRDASQVSKSAWWADPAKHKRKDVLRLLAQSDERFARWNETLGDRAFLIDHAQYDGKPEGFRPMLDWLGADLSPEKVEEICARRLGHVKHYQPSKIGIKARLRKLIKS